MHSVTSSSGSQLLGPTMTAASMHCYAKHTMYVLPSVSLRQWPNFKQTARQGSYDDGLAVLLHTDTWRGITFAQYHTWAAEVWHVLVLRASRMYVLAIIDLWRLLTLATGECTECTRICCSLGDPPLPSTLGSTGSTWSPAETRRRSRALCMMFCICGYVDLCYPVRSLH
jgi:hypothetical protein